MKIKFFKLQELDRNLKATVHKTGKMGFTIEAARKMGLGVDKSISIGVNEESEEDENLYVVVNESKTEDNFSVLKAGAYYYVNTKPLFATLKLDYKKNNLSYDISKEEIDDMEVYVFKLKQKEKENK